MFHEIGLGVIRLVLSKLDIKGLVDGLLRQVVFPLLRQAAAASGVAVAPALEAYLEANADQLEAFILDKLLGTGA